jgi:hypothetical protein
MSLGVCNTNGKGFWNKTPREITVTKLEVDYISKDLNYGELLVYFDPKEWDITQLGLIYTDPQWIKDFQELLQKLGFSNDAVNDIHYGSHGSQGIDFVSIDIGNIFIREVGCKVCNCLQINLKYQNYFH